jgi:hypothetical protein
MAKREDQMNKLSLSIRLSVCIFCLFMNSVKSLLIIILSLTWMLGITVASQATTYTWIGGNAGSWENNTNWSPSAGVPGGADDVVINSGSPHIYQMDSVRGLSVGPGGQLFIEPGINSSLRFFANVTNDGIITLRGGDTGYASFLDCHDLIVTFTGSGTLVLGGDLFYDQLVNSGWGGHFINDTGHTIRGGGTIGTFVENHGQIIADNVDLYFTGGVQGAPGSVMKASGAANRLRLYGSNPTLYSGGQILPQDGLVYLQNATVRNISFGPGHIESHQGTTFQEGITFTPGAQVTVYDGAAVSASSGYTVSLTNNGTITTALDVNNNTVTLTGTGTANLTGLGNRGWGGTLINDVTHTIQGSGNFDLGGFTWTNNGTLRVANGTLNVGSVAGAGTTTVKDNGNLVIYPGCTLQTGNFSMSPSATLTVGNWQGGSLDLSKDFTFSQTDPAKCNWDPNTTLQMSGGGAQQQSLEVGGRDYSLSSTGFSSNFNLPALNLAGAGTYVNLVDNIDNGHRPPREALYVDSLNVPAGTTLNLNTIHLYTYYPSSPTIYQVKAGDGNKFGGGQIINRPLKPVTASVNSLLLSD